MDQLPHELNQMRRLNEWREVPLLNNYFQRILADGWLHQNAHIYQLYEVGTILHGYWGVIPVTSVAYHAFVRGPRCPWRDLQADDILPEADYLRAITGGQPVYVWIESFTYADEHAFRIVGHDLLDHLQQLPLAGVLAESSCTQSKENCHFLGLQELRAYERCPTGIRRVWCADMAALANPEWPFGPPTQSLKLTRALKRVAYWFYLKWDKQGPLTEESVAFHLHVKPNTVKDHLRKIRTRAEEVIGSRERERISLWLHLHPSEVSSPDEQARV